MVFLPRYHRVVVGWLARDRDFRRAAGPTGFVEALIRVHDGPGGHANGTRGFHCCEFCPAPGLLRDGLPHTVHGDRSLFLGSAESAYLFRRRRDGCSPPRT
ncbi:MAG TPA: hypothetical protein VLH10_10605 [Yinghuangia sp.]|uniref:DUF7919 family protein n=1 Tax=Yinghuangia sp. YIM S10712 TaxID=3436930 RepID=UPI002BD99CD6|nr:hypothetical protein [Yinghuangia sp.]